MSDFNIVVAHFGHHNRVVMTDTLYQYDYGQQLKIEGITALPQTFQAHFSNVQHSGVSITVTGINGVVDVPNSLLMTGKRIYCWIYVTETGSGETVYQILMPVQSRPMPEYYDVEDVGVFDSVVNQVAEYAATATTGATSATASATAAAGSATAAAASASAAADSAENAAASEDNAEASASAAQASDASAATAATTATTKAAQAAQSATSAGSAADRAEAAQEAAETAQEAAETAATSATADADTATAKATAAAESATTASTKATDATNAATTATAQAAAAEAAKTTAVEAKTAAQSAQSAAETAATTATAKATEAAASATAAAQAAASINTPDSALSDTSTNAVQNKVVTAEFTNVKSAISTFTGFEKIVFTSGGYINTSGNTVDVNTVVANSLYRYAVVDCSEGDGFTITGLGGSSPRLWCFINSVGDVLSKAYDTESRTDYVLTAPGNSAKLIINDRSNGVSYKGVPYTMPDVEAELNAKIDKTDADLANLADITTTVDWDSMTATIQTGIAYNTDNTSGTAWSGANSYIYTIVPGEVYRVSTTVVANAKYYGVLFYDDTTYLSGEVQGIAGTQQAITNHEFSAPLNANKAVITTYSAVTPSLAKKTLKPYIDDSVGAIAPNYVKYDGTTLTVKCRYNASEDLVVRMKKRGNNELFDFDRIFTVDRTNVLDNNVSSIRNILTANTDCFSPHQIKAVNNADGDSTDIFLTGGNHNHNNVATAVCRNVKVYVDGEEVDDVSRLAGEVVVTWQNLIQAYNTWKSDGSGRAVLQEDIRLEIHGNVFNATVEQTALEDIDQSVYYGLQSIDTPYQTIVFVGGNDRTAGAINASRNSGNLTSRRTIAKNVTTGDALETYVDNIDLGTFDYTGETFSIFTANNKCYYAVLRSRTIRMSSGANYYLYGGYKFYSLT